MIKQKFGFRGISLLAVLFVSQLNLSALAQVDHAEVNKILEDAFLYVLSNAEEELCEERKPGENAVCKLPKNIVEGGDCEAQMMTAKDQRAAAYGSIFISCKPDKYDVEPNSVSRAWAAKAIDEISSQGPPTGVSVGNNDLLNSTVFQNTDQTVHLAPQRGAFVFHVFPKKGGQWSN